MASFFPFVWPGPGPAPPSAPVVEHVPAGAAKVAGDAGGAGNSKIEHLYVRQAETRQAENGSKLYTVFRIELHGPVRIWSVWRRYSEFDALHAKLCAVSPDGVRTPPPGKLPPKTYFFSTVNSEAATEERRKALEAWLRGILQARDSRWRESQAWNEFLAVPGAKGAAGGGAEGPAPSPASRRKPGFVKAFTSESWLDEATELSTVARQARALLHRRDALLAKGEVAQAAGVSAEVRSLLTTFGTRFAVLQAGLQAFAPAESAGGRRRISVGGGGGPAPAPVLSEGEYTRRHDMVQRFKDERDALSKLAGSTIRAPASALAGSSAASAADRNALLSGPSGDRRGAPFHFRAGGRNSIWGQEAPSPGANAPRRVFGSPAPQTAASPGAPPPPHPVETEATRQLSNEGLLQLQQQIMEQQDQHIEGFSALLNRQKQIGLAINNELENQNALLGELDADVDTTQAKLKFAQTKLKRINK